MPDLKSQLLYDEKYIYTFRRIYLNEEGKIVDINENLKPRIKK